MKEEKKNKRRGKISKRGEEKRTMQLSKCRRRKRKVSINQKIEYRII